MCSYLFERQPFTPAAAIVTLAIEYCSVSGCDNYKSIERGRTLVNLLCCHGAQSVSHSLYIIDVVGTSGGL